MYITWDEAKNRTNYAKHGVRFELAVRVFDDPYALSVQDRIVRQEPRWQTLGLVEGVVVLLVAHTLGEDDGYETVRIISARKATAHERRAYEQRRKGKSE